MVRSMTAFARVVTPSPEGNLIWELKSVNHRYLEMSTRLGECFRGLEIEFREQVRGVLERGKVDLSLSLEASGEMAPKLNLNIPAAKAIWEAAETLSQALGISNTLTVESILRWPGVMNDAESSLHELQALAKTSLQQALQQLQENRAREGRKLSEQIEQRLAQIAQNIVLAKPLIPQALAQIKLQLLSKVSELSSQIDPARLEQELLLCAQRMDVSEELDRLRIHVEEARHLMKQGGALGRRFDFLLQEFNREANTLGSKSLDRDLTRIVLDTKVLIEQIREQVQNIE